MPVAPRLILYGCGCSSGVEHNLAKVGVEGSNPFARSKVSITSRMLDPASGRATAVFIVIEPPLSVQPIRLLAPADPAMSRG